MGSLTGSSFMTVESDLGEGEGRGATGGELGESGPSRTGRRRQKRPAPTAVQRLFDTCREVFADGRPGGVPRPADVARLRDLLDGMCPTDVGLSQNMPYFRKPESKVPPPITYLHLYGGYKFSIGIFCLPPTGVIPLHNHPGMTVFSKLLFGSMHIKSYDWVNVETSVEKTIKHSHFQPEGVRLAKVKTNAVFTAPCETSVLYPADGGNMHCFEAMTPCAVLDVLGPPYSDLEGRHCQYYDDFPYASFSDQTEHEMLSASDDADLAPGGSEGPEGYAWLEERERPDGFLVVGAKYKGPRIVEY